MLEPFPHTIYAPRIHEFVNAGALPTHDLRTRATLDHLQSHNNAVAACPDRYRARFHRRRGFGREHGDPSAGGLGSARLRVQQREARVVKVPSAALLLRRGDGSAEAQAQARCQLDFDHPLEGRLVDQSREAKGLGARIGQHRHQPSIGR